MHLRVLPLLAVALLAGCASPADDPMEDDADDAAVPAPEPVSIHEVVNLVEAAPSVSRTWSFTLAPNATEVSMRFYATSKAVIGTGLPICLSFQTPDGDGSAGTCQGGVGNIQLAPSVVMLEQVFYEKGADAKPGDYAFTLDAQPNLTDFHAVVNVSYA